MRWTLDPRQGEWMAVTGRGYVLAVSRARADSRGRWGWYVFDRWSGETACDRFGHGHERSLHMAKRKVTLAFARAGVPPSRYRPNPRWSRDFQAAINAMVIPYFDDEAAFDAWCEQELF